MSKKLILGFIYVFFVLLICSEAYAMDEEVGKKIEAFFEENKESAAGISTAVFNSQGTIYQNHFGYQDKENKIPTDANTVYEWGSITKLMIWVSVMQLWEEGKIDLNKSIEEYLSADFYHKLQLKEPITMMNLMNHDAGFQEKFSDLFVKEEKNLRPLRVALMDKPPAQIYKPGEITAYSNYGAALAAYIVEEISGMEFHEYVKENIFEPLNMKNTSIKADLSDNLEVKEAFSKTRHYYGNGEYFPDAKYYIELYPAGSAVGTLSDLLKFAQSLNSKYGSSTLFEKEETLGEMLKPTSFFPETDIMRNSHGLWNVVYGVSTLGHGGNTAGSSSNLLIDQVSGVGMVVMTNQSMESRFTAEMREIVFGKTDDFDEIALRPNPKTGLFRTARTIRKGPLAISDIYGFRFGTGDLEGSFWTESKEGIERISLTHSDRFLLSITEIIFTILLLSGWGLGAVVSIFYLLIDGLILNLIRGKNQKRQNSEKWSYISAGSQVGVLAGLFILTISLLTYKEVGEYRWVYILNILLLITCVIAFNKFIKKDHVKRRWIDKAVVVLSLFPIIGILYWNLYQFWAL